MGCRSAAFHPSGFLLLPFMFLSPFPDGENLVPNHINIILLYPNTYVSIAVYM